ncbi:hypothetical protein [Natranaeroarchaeum aerophilus]|uniref:DUF8055 domain-containing protein n=1 Tax=Natranaeroarchaeum aerophilus TaxID=2917711 RepID=A0AAE3K6P0_9EURY|nr:hypothetical protein [Natranaeroarchaeum aerophilus]MCL9814615.1 hypothetical protein [Natranaeroarchaeum aerophilus]
MASEHHERIERLAERARQERQGFDPPETTPAPERAQQFLQEGVGELVSLYIDGRSGGDFARFSEHEWDLLHRALDDWLQLYARCYGRRLERGFQIRTLAELVIDTHNLHDAVMMATKVPSREYGETNEDLDTGVTQPSNTGD